MATKVTVRKSAKTTTAIATGNVVPMIGSNQPELIDEKLILAQVSLAIADQAEAGKRLGSAVQRMAYAVMAEHNQMVANGTTKDLPKLDLVAGTTKSITFMMGLLSELFIGKQPQGESNHDYVTAERAYTANKQLLRRGIELASLIRRANCGLEQFNTKLGNWSVPALRLFPAGVTPIGNLGNQMVLLDGRGYGGFKGANNESFVKVQASVKQFTDSFKPAKPQNGNRVGAGQGADMTVDLKKVSVKDLSNKLDNQTGRLLLLASYRNLLNRYAAPLADEGAPPKFSDLPKTEQNTLSDLFKLYDALRARDNDKPQAKAVA